MATRQIGSGGDKEEALESTANQSLFFACLLQNNQRVVCGPNLCLSPSLGVMFNIGKILAETPCRLDKDDPDDLSAWM